MKDVTILKTRKGELLAFDLKTKRLYQWAGNNWHLTAEGK